MTKFGNILLIVIYVSTFSNYGVTESTDTKAIEEVRKYISRTLLNLFGWKEWRKISHAERKTVIPEGLKDIYSSLIYSNYLNATKFLSKAYHANLIRSFTHSKTATDDKFNSDHKFRLYFNVTSVSNSEKFHAAELVLNSAIHPHNSIHEKFLPKKKKIFIYDIIRPKNVKKNQTLIKKLLAKKVINLKHNHIIKFDIESAFERWLKNPKENHGMLIKVFNMENNKLYQNESQSYIRLKRHIHMDDTLQPAVYSYMSDGKSQTFGETIKAMKKKCELEKIDLNKCYDLKSRNKRNSRRNHRRKLIRKTCRRFSLYVDFIDVGWSDWIVAPAGIEIFFCAGSCDYPLTEHMNTTNHAIVQTMMNSINPSIVPKSCCVPTSLASLSLLYVEGENKVVLKNYQDMQVTGCGCL